MWKLNEIHAQNLCAFKQLDYTLLQGHTTLIFGNNMDNDSQGSNGSGKSAMLEAIAIALTGETLRKVKADEIINDAEDEAIVSAVLSNDEQVETLTINRKLSRKKAQDIQITIQRGSDTEEIAQATVADYNKYVLDVIGLTKDDIFSNYILSKHKYNSFLSSSDREKKEIINRFSNGVLVDESIAALESDMQPIEEQLRETENAVATSTGRVEALEEQINNALNEQTERNAHKAERLASWKQAIADKRAYIREQEAAAAKAEELLERYDDVDVSWQKIEQGKTDVVGCYETLLKDCERYAFDKPNDYIQLSKNSQSKLEELEKALASASKEVGKQEKQLSTAKTAFEKLHERYQKFSDGYDKKAEKINERINSLIDTIRQLEGDNEGLKKQRNRLEGNIADLHKQLAGVIVCPQCQHEFTLGGDVNIQEARLELQDREGEVKDITENISKNQQDIEAYTAKGREVRKEQNELVGSKAEWSAKITDEQTKVDMLARQVLRQKSQLETLQADIATTEKAIHDLRVHLFDEAYDILDAAVKTQENVAKQAEVNISNAKGAIASYEESIRDIDKSSETDMIENLKASKRKYEKELGQAIDKKEAVERQLNAYKKQASLFVEFKTYLANTKIEALSHITNEFLEAIGSDIRIAFSGYTVLKSGKVRDKISVSLIRDGVDCGSFDKFSEGEKARVNLANILAMHKLTNVSCDEGKGLDLLILDEILEATDEQGLSNIFNALNHLCITSLVVSHGNIAEGYPYKTVVNKQNGVSYIDE